MSAEKHRYWPQALGTLILSGLVVWVTAGALLPERSELETRGGETAAQPEAESAVEAKPEQTAKEVAAGAPPPGAAAGETCPPFPRSRTRLADLPDFPMLTRARLAALKGGSSKSVVYVTALFCQPCKLLSPVLDQMRGSFKEGVEVFMIVQEEDEEDVLGQVGVTSFPSVLVLDGGSVVDRRSGSQPWSRTQPCVEDRNQKVLMGFFSNHGLIDARRGSLE